jgi:hypothetical protein
MYTLHLMERHTWLTVLLLALIPSAPVVTAAESEHPAGAETAAGKPTPDEIVSILRQGNERFCTGQSVHPHADAVADLFMKSAATRELVRTGKAQVIGAVYDMETGRVTWLDRTRVKTILARVEASPQRAVQPFANSDE